MANNFDKDEVSAPCCAPNYSSMITEDVTAGRRSQVIDGVSTNNVTTSGKLSTKLSTFASPCISYLNT